MTIFLALLFLTALILIIAAVAVENQAAEERDKAKAKEKRITARSLFAGAIACLGIALILMFVRRRWK